MSDEFESFNQPSVIAPGTLPGAVVCPMPTRAASPCRSAEPKPKGHRLFLNILITRTLSGKERIRTLHPPFLQMRPFGYDGWTW